MPEDIEPSFALETTEKLMQLQTLLQVLKALRANVEDSETLQPDVKDLLDGYETTIDTLFKMLITSNEHIISQDEMLNDIFAKIDSLTK